MIRTVLIDLDDTLLENSMDRFLPAYFQRLGDYLSDLVQPDRMLPALMAGTSAMLANQDPTSLLERKFADIFYPELGLDEAELRERVTSFYTEIFPELEPLTAVKPGARQFMRHLFASNYEVVIATNPLFPRLAIEARLRWAQVPVDEFDYSLVTSYENFHFTKPNPAYFTEILGLLGRSLSDALMIGNDISADLVPADQLGMPVFHLHAEPDGAYSGGDFEAAAKWLESAWDEANPGVQHDPEVILARLKGHLGALLTMAGRCDLELWRARPGADAWAPIEIVAHFADVEREVNLPRLQRFKRDNEPHLTAFDTDVWALERGYLNYPPETTLSNFIESRQRLIEELRAMDRGHWQRTGIHSLLGPTTLAEVMHIAAEHDLLHLAEMRRAIGFPP
ncbi:MAG: DinB family protein [Anaerolineales bacterium]|nr:DinB family protein [Anaerolineales bacterium]